MTVGARFIVTLPGLGAAGYRWSATVDDADVVAVESVTPQRHSHAPPGSSASETFAFVALAPGETTVHLAQTRSFEPGAEPRDTRDLRVRVIPRAQRP
jgi:predicted secreted protein